MANLMKTTARVNAVNRAHAHAKKLYEQLRAIFEPYVGEKVVKQDGTLMAKYAKLLPEFPVTPRLHVYRHTSDYSLAWTVKTSEPDSGDPNGYHTVTYYEVTVYIGDLRGGVLTELPDRYKPDYLRTDFTVEEVVQKRAEYRRAREVYEKARSEISDFGEYDT
jgi:hypothetical protein